MMLRLLRKDVARLLHTGHDPEIAGPRRSRWQPR